MTDEAEIWVDAPPQVVWSLVTDITRYGEWSPENRGGKWRGDPGPGAVFKGSNRHGFMRWTTTCTVVDYDEPSRFTFDVSESRMRWGFRLEPDRGGTRVIEWRSHSGVPALPIRLIQGSGLIGRQREQLMLDGMRRTLDGLKQQAERSA